MAKPLVNAQDMAITYNKGKQNEYKALRKITTEFYEREYIILFGPSGCGKSTLMYSILGTLAPSDGQMMIRGEDIYKYTPDEMVEYQRNYVGIIYQSFNLLTSLTVMDNVTLPLIFCGVGPKERAVRGKELLERFGIEHIGHKLPNLLSGGQQQRVAVARSLVLDPALLLADEPVGNLDSVSSEQVMGKLAEINERDRKTVILITHDAKFLPYAHRIYYLKDGFVKRIVVNPEKRQIKRVRPGETIVTEIEQLARLYPYSEPLELKVKSAVNYLTQSIDFYQIEKLEKAALLMLDRKMGREMFYELLMRPQPQGGVGLTEVEAVEMTRRMDHLVNYSHDVKQFRDEIHKDELFLHQYKFVERLKFMLLGECQVELAGEQAKAFNTVVAERIGGIITREELEQRLVLPLHLDGVALTETGMYCVTRHLEKLIAQGGYTLEGRQNEGAQDKRA